MSKSKFLFGDIVVINHNHVGVILKTWKTNNKFDYDIFDRMTSQIENHEEDDIDRYRVRHKYLDEDELSYQDM